MTLVAGTCTYDWVLAASGGDTAEAERAFDAWWQGFVFEADRVTSR